MPDTKADKGHSSNTYFHDATICVLSNDEKSHPFNTASLG